MGKIASQPAIACHCLPFAGKMTSIEMLIGDLAASQLKTLCVQGLLQS